MEVLAVLRVEGAVDWRLLEPTLLRIANRELTPDERELREGWTDSYFGGTGLFARDLARELVVQVDLDAITVLEPAARMAWLDDALRVRQAEHPLHLVSGHILLAFAIRGRWTDAEADRIRSALADPGFVADDTGRAVLLVVASGRWGADGDLEKRAWSVVESRLTDNPADLLVAQEWLLASAHAERLALAVRQLRTTLAILGLDPLPFLTGLSRPRLDPLVAVREQAMAVLRELAAEPELAETEVIRSLLDDPGDKAME
jgi:hypothetical protein